jgi:anaerobic magnesium-protoporphyrin IX monomethyl ester cyclase
MKSSTGPVVLAVAPSMPGSDTDTFLGRLPNIGILYLASALEAAGYDVVTLDRQYSHASPLKLAAEIHALRPSLVGFTLYDHTVRTTLQVVSILRWDYKGPVVVGGYTPTFHAEDILACCPDVNYVVVREGEAAIVALADHLRGARRIEDVPNLVFRDGNAIRANGEIPLGDVSQLPWPRRNWSEPGDLTPLITRRGCLSRCSFCSMVPFYDKRFGPPVRWRRPADVVDEIEHCLDHGAREFILYDDDFGMSTEAERAWCSEWVSEIRRRHVRFRWLIEARVTDVVRGSALLEELMAVGLRHVSMGVESMLPRQLKLYNKGYKQADVFKSVEILEHAGVDYQTNVIFWDPWLTLAEAVEHVELLGQIHISKQLASANFPWFANVLTARKGTAIHTMLQDARLLRLEPGTFWDYRYDFISPEVRTFHGGPFEDFLRRCRRMMPRPSALWISVVQLEHRLEWEKASLLRQYATAISEIETRYLKELFVAAQTIGASTDMRRALQGVHNEFTPRMRACSGILADSSVEPKSSISHAQDQIAHHA